MIVCVCVHVYNRLSNRMYYCTLCKGTAGRVNAHNGCHILYLVVVRQAKYSQEYIHPTG